MSSAEGNNIEGESPAKLLSSVSNKQQQNKSRVSFSDLTTIHYIGGDSNNSNKDERNMKLSCEDEDEKIKLPSRCDNDDESRGRKAASFKYDYENTEMFKLPQTSSHDDSKSSEANKLKKRMLLCDSFYSSDAASFTTDTDHHGNDVRRNLMMMQLHNRHHHYDDTDESLNQFEAGSYLEYVGAAKRSRLRRKLSRNTLAPPPTRRHHRAYRNPDLYEDESERFDVVNLTLQIGILLILCYTLYKKV